MTMNLLYMLGSMITPSRNPAYVTGAMMHAVNGIVFALTHAAFYQALDLETSLAAWGLLFGFIHYLVVGMGMGMIGTMHPLMRSASWRSRGPSS